MPCRDIALDPTLLARLDGGIERLGELPVLDQTLVRVRTLSDDPDSTTHELVEALQADANISANLLRFANSAHSATPVRASTLHQAVTLIGRRAVGRMTLEAEVCSFFERAPGGGGTARGQLHIHAVQVAGCAAEIARRAGTDPAAAHLAGLLHDLGKLVLPVAFDVETLDALAAATPAGPARAVAEREALGVDHAAAGARFARSAGLDATVVDAIDRHHGGDEASEISLVAYAVQAANATVAMLNGHPADDALLNAAVAALGLQLSDLEEIAATAMPAAFADQRGPESLADEIARLEREARTDDLTGLANRRHWSATTRDQVAVRPATILVCDVDHFKRVNDAHGHHTGDFVLVEIGRILAGHGFAGRLGGDEFALLIPTPDPGGAIAALILDEVAAAFPGDELEVSVSIGTTTSWTPGADLTELLQRADAALYEVKRAGRGAFRAAAEAA
jgi:diguanylate cyclase (GGDEF)-like protein/putative nucleotidyltransferase with HDIG domain